jgi:hypothetical protein
MLPSDDELHTDGLVAEDALDAEDTGIIDPLADPLGDDATKIDIDDLAREEDDEERKRLHEEDTDELGIDWSNEDMNYDSE